MGSDEDGAEGLRRERQKIVDQLLEEAAGDAEPDDEYVVYLSDADDAYRRKVFEDTLRTLRNDSARDVLASLGDAVEERIRRCLSDAAKLREHGFFGPAVISTVTAIDLVFRFLLLKPLVRGAFLSNEWEAVLTERIYSSRRGHDRDLLKKILRVWGHDISVVKLKTGQNLWQSLEEILKIRNGIVHNGALASDHDIEVALQCAEALLIGVVYEIAEKLGFSVKAGVRWSCVSLKNKYGDTSEEWYIPWDPFENKPFGPHGE